MRLVECDYFLQKNYRPIESAVLFFPEALKYHISPKTVDMFRGWNMEPYLHTQTDLLTGELE
jgi:hypothetical protein